jgi:hypothetical protein
MLDKVDFQAGGFGANYGGKNASLVALHLKEGSCETPTFSGYYDLMGWEANYNGPSYLHKTTSLLLSVRHIDLNNVLAITDNKETGSPIFSDYVLKTTTEINYKHKISLLGIYSPETYDRTLEHLYAAKNLLDPYLASMKNNKSLAGLNWQMLTGKRSFLRTTVYATDTDDKMRDGYAYTDQVNGREPSQDEVVTRDDVGSIDQHETNYGLRSEFVIMPSQQITLTSGVDIQQVDYSYKYVLSGLDTGYVFGRNDYRPDANQQFVVHDPARLNARFDKKMSSLAAYTQWSQRWGTRLTLTPGIRVDYFDYNDEVQVSPRFSARYQLDAKTNLNAATGIYSQVPEYNIIAMNGLKRKLKNETAYHYILGCSRYLSNEWKLNVETYYKAFDNLITHPDRTTSVYANVGDGWSSGFDVSLIRRLSDKFFGQISYSYSISKRNDHDGNGEYNSDFNKPHIVNIMAGNEFNKEWQLSANWQYASGYPTDGYVVHADVHNNPDYMRYSKEIVSNNSRRIQSSHTLNVRADYRKQIGPAGIILYLDILNMYDHLNVTEKLFMKRNGKHDDQGYGMMPTFGLRVEL